MAARAERMPILNQSQSVSKQWRQFGPGVNLTVTTTLDLAYFATNSLTGFFGDLSGNGMCARRIVMLAAGTTATIPLTDAVGNSDAAVGINGAGNVGVAHDAHVWKIRPMGSPANGPTFRVYW